MKMIETNKNTKAKITMTTMKTTICYFSGKAKFVIFVIPT